MAHRSLYILGLLPSFLLAHPTAPEVVQGNPLFAHPSNHLMQVITPNDKTIINWHDFSIHSCEVTQFVLPNSNASILNRVTSDVPSKIFGTLLSNGTVYLVNPNGIIIGQDATINTHAFVASTFDVLNREFLEGREIRFRGNSNKAIVNYGTIKATDGDVVLIGRYITNDGTISTPSGDTYLAVGQEILLLPSGRERVSICPQKGQAAPIGTGIHTTEESTIEAIKTRLLADGNPYRFAINHEGKIDALDVQKHNGDVYLVAENGAIEVRGEIHVPGGHVRVLGDHVALLEKGRIDASSDRKGGDVLFGGSYQGKDPSILNSSYTFLDTNAFIDVSANLEGNGGRAIIWSDGTTQWYGSIAARGGERGGNGGLVEVSGKVHLDPHGVADRSAQYGVAGKLLLDPSDILITNSSTTHMISIGGPGPILTIYQPSGGPPAPTPNVLYYTDLIAALSAGPVEITTSSTASGNGDITINTSLTSTTGFITPYTLTLTSDRDINIENSIQNAGSGDIVLDVGRDLHINGTTNKSTLGSKDGNVYITTKRNVHLSGGSGQAQIGYDNPTASGNIFLDIGNDLILRSGARFALIGHTNSTQNPEPMTFTGDITISRVGRDILMNAGSTDYQFCQIGHAIPNYSPAFSNKVTATGDITIQNVHGSLTLVGGHGGLGTYTLIGHGGRESAYDDVLSGNIFVSSKGPISIFGATHPGSGKFCGIGFAQDFSGVATHCYQADHITVLSESDINVRAGHGKNHAFIGALSGEARTGTTVGTLGAINISGNTLNLVGDKNGCSQADALVGVAGNNHSLYFDVDASLQGGLNILGGAPGEGASNAYINNGKAGEVRIVINHGDASLFGGAGAGRAYVTSSGNLFFDVVHGSLYLTSRDQAYLLTNANGYIHAGMDINIQGDPCTQNMASIIANRYLTLFAGRDINLIDNAAVQNLNGTLSLIADKNIYMSPLASIANHSDGSVNIVVDHYFFKQPNYGSGSFLMEMGAQINSNGPLCIFTSQQHLNTIEGTLNGTQFTPGKLYANSTSEVWLTHFSSNLQHTPGLYTIFYKNGVFSAYTVERNQVLVSEMLTTLHPYDAFLGWFMKFQEVYDMDAYEKVKPKETSSSQVNQNQLYYLRMKKHFDLNPKINNMILFPKDLQIEKL